MAVQSWKHCRESVKRRTRVMWNHKTIISLLCVCVVAVNPVMAAHTPCCCTKKAEAKPSCCYANALKVSQSKSKSQSCCNRTSAPSPSFKEPCRCCVKSVPQPVPTKNPPIKAGVDFAIDSWNPQHSLRTANSVEFTEVEGPCGPSGLELLALYCRWLE